MRSIFYHSSPYRNLYSIMTNGIQPSEDGFVKLCHHEDDAVVFGVDKSFDDDYEHFVVLPVLLDMDEVEQYYEQPSRSVSAIRCYKFGGTIPLEQIACYLTDILLCKYSHDATD